MGFRVRFWILKAGGGEREGGLGGGASPLPSLSACRVHRAQQLVLPARLRVRRPGTGSACHPTALSTVAPYALPVPTRRAPTPSAPSHARAIRATSPPPAMGMTAPTSTNAQVLPRPRPGSKYIVARLANILMGKLSMCGSFVIHSIMLLRHQQREVGVEGVILGPPGYTIPPERERVHPSRRGVEGWCLE